MIPLDAFGGEGATLAVGNGLFIHRHQAGARASFDGHVADRHAAFHAQGADGRTSKLDGVAGAARGADLADDGQHDVLGRDAAANRAFNLDQQVLGLLGQQRLRGHHVFNFAGADAVGQRTKGTVRAGVAVAADHGHAGQCGPVFRPNHVHDALALVQEGKVGRRAAGLDVVVQRGDLQLADRVGNAVITIGPAGGGRVVVGGGHDAAHPPHLAAGQAQPFKGLRAGDFVHQVAVDVERGGAVFFGVDDVFVPQLVVQGSGGHGLHSPEGYCPGSGWLGADPGCGHKASTKRCTTVGSTAWVRTASR